MLIVGIVLGGILQHWRSGYHFEIREEQNIISDLGVLRLTSFHESVGFSIMDTGSSSLEFDGRTIFKARRTFQENYPIAQNVEVFENVIRWNDGWYEFALKVEELPRNSGGNQGNSPGE